MEGYGGTGEPNEKTSKDLKTVKKFTRFEKEGVSENVNDRGCGQKNKQTF